MGLLLISLWYLPPPAPAPEWGQSGATAIEYGLIAAGISVVIIGAVSSVGSNLITTFTTVSNKLASAGK